MVFYIFLHNNFPLILNIEWKHIPPKLTNQINIAAGSEVFTSFFSLPLFLRFCFVLYSLYLFHRSLIGTRNNYIWNFIILRIKFKKKIEKLSKELNPFYIILTAIVFHWLINVFRAIFVLFYVLIHEPKTRTPNHCVWLFCFFFKPKKKNFFIFFSIVVYWSNVILLSPNNQIPKFMNEPKILFVFTLD